MKVDGKDKHTTNFEKQDKIMVCHPEQGLRIEPLWSLVMNTLITPYNNTLGHKRMFAYSIPKRNRFI